ncbi:hypothetical protein H5410_032262 [Solanum commersonii]|uniref:Uncharacterized protein n=1 Tax=Solanum commersonii TaxID=4109 RepID=A0A9J5YP58_SOLCO|nr:hypothetical protein H5410_032262 [Solanum commersonii]
MQKEGKCKFKYPKQLVEQTTKGKNSYPLYKRPKMITPIKVIKYIYKYICKGHDKIAFSVHNNDTNVEIDEIKEYQSARWRLPIAIAFDGQQFVSFKNNQTVDQIINNPMIRKTMLTEFFLMNTINNDAINLNLLYKEFPQHFVWSSSYKMWSRENNAFLLDVLSHVIQPGRKILS